jgi:hypothetical protein
VDEDNQSILSDSEKQIRLHQGEMVWSMDSAIIKENQLQCIVNTKLPDPTTDQVIHIYINSRILINPEESVYLSIPMENVEKMGIEYKKLSENINEGCRIITCGGLVVISSVFLWFYFLW